MNRLSYMALLGMTPLLLATSVAAQVANAQPILQDMQMHVMDRVRSAAGMESSRIEVRFEPPETWGIPATCMRLEPFSPSASRYWGKSTVGVRCAEGATWSRLIPAVVTIWGPAWVSTGSLPAGATLSAPDLQQAEVELTRERPGLGVPLEKLIGKSLSRSIPAGTPVHPDWTRLPTVVSAGDPVRLRVAGGGFMISASGQSLSSATDGQSVRVKTEFGRILVGTAREGRIVDIQP